MSTKPDFIYTLVAYRENGVDTCRGCVMGRSDSAFELTVFTDADKLARHWARHMADAPHGLEYCSYEYTLLLNGHDRDNDPDWDDEAYLDPATGQSWYELERERVQQLVEAETSAIQQAQRLEQQRLAAEAEAKRQVQARREAEATEARERAELARLQAKFGSAQ